MIKINKDDIPEEIAWKAGVVIKERIEEVIEEIIKGVDDRLTKLEAIGIVIERWYKE